MATAAPRRPAPPASSAVPSVAADEGALLAALPIAAAVIRRESDKRLTLCACNDRFAETVEQSTMGGMDKVNEACLRGGQIHDHIQGWLEGELGDEYEFRDGFGPDERHYRLKLATLPRMDGRRRALLTVLDRTAEVRSERHLREEMLRDSLTGLPNRLAFAEMIELAGKTADATYAVLVVDLLRFSRVNESLGSLAGDELLITFARRLLSTIRAGDRLARTGGNEFGLLVRLERGVSDARRAAARIEDVLAGSLHLTDLEIRVECAVGIAMMASGKEPEELFRNAQFACKVAKQSGRAEVYQPEEASAARRRFSLETELRRALDRDQLDMAYQPLIDLQTGAVSGFEALARWHHPERGEISPNEFIPVAEESGLIVTLGRWAMNRAACTLASWDDQAGKRLPLYVSVNLSAIQVARDDIAGMVREALSVSRIGGERLSLELTETSIVQDPGRATRVLDALKGLDTTVAMDDFGTGYSSLAYLQRLPIDVLKIDRSFISAMRTDVDSDAIVRAVLGLASALGMSTTAEGIESADLAERLRALGCNAGQGFHFARPLTSAQALDYLRTNTLL